VQTKFGPAPSTDTIGVSGTARQNPKGKNEYPTATPLAELVPKLRDEISIDESEPTSRLNPRFVPGDQYDPFGLFEGICIPISIVCASQLSDRSKLTFGVVGKLIGNCESRKLQLNDVAAALGVSVDTVSRDIKQIENAALMGHRQTGKGGEYFHIWHSLLTASLREEFTDLSPLITGDRFNPWKKFKFVLIPDSLVASREITWAAKLLFGVLSYHGRSGACFAGDERLSAELGKPVTQFRRLRKELVCVGLVDYDASRQYDNYHFLFQPVLAPSLHPVWARNPGKHANLESAKRLGPGEHVPAGSQPGPATGTPDAANKHRAYKEEKIGREFIQETIKKREDIRSGPINQSTEKDREEIRKCLRTLFQNLVHSPLDCDSKTVSILLKMARDRGYSPHRLVADLYRLSKRIERLHYKPGHIQSWKYIVRAMNEQWVKAVPEI
jgi:hypothetical protein